MVFSKYFYASTGNFVKVTFWTVMWFYKWLVSLRSIRILKRKTLSYGKEENSV